MCVCVRVCACVCVCCTYLWFLGDDNVQVDVCVNEMAVLVPTNSAFDPHQTVLLVTTEEET